LQTSACATSPPVLISWVRGLAGAVSEKLYPAATLPDWIFHQEKSILAQAGPGIPILTLL
jgi:hypothetical protein